MIKADVSEEHRPPENSTQGTDDRDEERFLAACAWLRHRHLVAFFLGLFSLGIPYSMAGIGGADPGKDHEPLVEFWSRGKVKWIACITLLGELYYLVSGFGRAFKGGSWVLIGLPIVILLALAIIEVLYEVIKKSDGFALTQVHTFGRDECFERIEGPALLASALIEKSPDSVRSTLGLLWAWLIGLVFVTTFFAGVALVLTVGLILVGIMVVLFVIGLILDRNDGPIYPPIKPDTLPDLPPVPLDGVGILDPHGSLAVFRRSSRIYEGRRQVGRVKGKTIYFFSLRRGTACAVYEIRGNEILELPSTRSYGRFDETAIYWGDGTVRHNLVEVTS